MFDNIKETKKSLLFISLSHFEVDEPRIILVDVRQIS